MKSRISKNEYSTKLGRIEEACARYSLGRTTMKKLAGEAQAVVKIGTCFLIDFTVMDSYFDRVREGNQ